MGTDSEHAAPMSDPEPPPQIDRSVLIAMQQLIQLALQVDKVSLDEAAGRAWGFCHARYPGLPATVSTEAVQFALMELQLLPPAPLTARLNGQEYEEVERTEMGQAITYMMAFDLRGKPHRAWRDALSSMAARHLMEHLRERGYVIMKPQGRPVGMGRP